MNIPASWVPIETKIFRFRQMAFIRLDAGEGRPQPCGDVCRLLLVITGEGIIEINHRKQLIRPGSWIVLQPGEPYMLRVQEGIGIAYYEIAFSVLSDPAGTGQSIEAGDSFWCGSLADREWGQVLTKVKQLYAGREEEDGLERFRFQIVFQEFMHLLIQTLSVRRQGSAEETVWSVVRYMEGHFQQQLSRDRLAQLAGMNQEYFSRLFKKVTGKTPKAYLTGIRLNHAKRELLRGKVAISDIAQHVGFEEGYYFSRKFKQGVGISPTEYANRQIGKVACTFFPFIDHMLALGITPYAAMLPGNHPLAPRVASSIVFGEDELELNERAAEQLSVAEPELILSSNYLNPEQEALLSRIAPTVPVVWDQDWRRTLRDIAVILGRSAEAEEALQAYKQSCTEAGEQVRRSLGEQTMALVRIHKRELRLYGGPGQGYTGPVLYGDLGLKAPPLVRELAWHAGVIGVTLDTLAALEADHILLVIDPDAEQHALEIVGSTEWQALHAVRSGKVHAAGYWIWMSCGTVMNSLKLQEAVRLLGGG